jgi:hypothetical protein
VRRRRREANVRAARVRRRPRRTGGAVQLFISVGLALESAAWFQHLILLKCDFLVSILSAFTRNLYRYQQETSSGTTEILAGSWRDKNALQVWDMGTGRLIQDVPFGAVAGEKNCQLYSARFGKSDGRCRGLVFAGGSGANEARVVHRASGRCVARVSGLATAVHSVVGKRPTGTTKTGTCICLHYQTRNLRHQNRNLH